jgi:hypothetical protein
MGSNHFIETSKNDRESYDSCPKVLLAVTTSSVIGCVVFLDKVSVNCSVS